MTGRVIDGHERAGQAAPLIGERVLDEPAVQCRFAAREAFDLVAVGERLEAHDSRPTL
jgi:hypothetical protein